MQQIMLLFTGENLVEKISKEVHINDIVHFTGLDLHTFFLIVCLVKVAVLVVVV